MSAADHINPSIRAFHISWDDTPPHELRPHENLHAYREDDNKHPEVLHMGSRDSAMQIYRTHLHEYEIDPDVVDPIVYGDAQYVMDKADNPAYATHREMAKNMKGVQPSLFETLPGDPLEAVRTGKVIQYRNYGENAGSISYMVPKSAIREGKVRHVGVTDAVAERKAQ